MVEILKLGLVKILNFKLIGVADVDVEDHVGNSLLIWELRFGHKAKLLSRL